MITKLKVALLPLLICPFLLAANVQVIDNCEKCECGCDLEQDNVTINEDLMHEHGLLNRLLLVYQEMANRLQSKSEKPGDLALLKQGASIVRDFLENHHEQMEEQYVFPTLVNAGKYIDLIQTLKEQHVAGRKITDFILAHSNDRMMQDSIQRQALADNLKLYIRMFRPHEAREGTVIFPQFRSLVSDEEYARLGEVFEAHEESLIGENGFGKLIKTVVSIEKGLGIYNLDQFTAQVD